LIDNILSYYYDLCHISTGFLVMEINSRYSLNTAKVDVKYQSIKSFDNDYGSASIKEQTNVSNIMRNIGYGTVYKPS